MSVELYLVIASLLGAIAAIVASQKNRSAGAWFVWGGLFGLIALLVLAALEPMPTLETVRKQEWQP